ncbi:MAG: hypothetical protein ABFD69_07375 [Candidatus Sumerlaeia bacterium]
MKRLVYCLYCLSGLIALGYQVVWFRVLVDRFGSTNLTFVLVVVNFIGGLGAGALASRRLGGFLERALRLKGPFQTYGLVELLIAAAALLTPLAALLPADLWGHFPYVYKQGIYQPTHVYQIAQILISTLLVFVPCFFMGITFPLLCHAFGDDAKFPSALYGWNTLGSCIGILGCQIVFLPWLGHDRTFLVIMGLNVALGLFFLVLGGWVPGPKAAAGRPAAPDAAEAAGGALFHPSVLLACAVLSGFISGALEGDMFKRVHFTGMQHSAAMSFISFWAIIAIFAGSVVVRLSRRLNLRALQFAFVLAFLVYFLIASPIPTRHGWQAPWAYSLLAWLMANVRAEIVTQLAYIGIFVFPAYFLVAMLLPYVCNRMQGNRRHLGLAYGLNTVAFCAGMMMFTWVATRVNAFYSFKLMTGTFAVTVVLVLLLREMRPLPPWQPLAGVAALAGLCLVTPHGFDRSYFRPGSPPTKYPARAMRSNGAHTTFVLDDPITSPRLFFDSHSMSGTGMLAQVYMRLMAHVPLMAQDAPESALLICFGVGNTASAIASHDSIKRLDIVDLNDQVFRTAPQFDNINRGVYSDQRVRLIHDDGRNYLNLTDRKYDLVTSEPPPPMQAGVYRLYSREYYDAVKKRLTPSGMMTQWLPIEQMPPRAVDLAVATFVQSFPFSYAFIGGARAQQPSTNIILVGCSRPLDLRRIEQWGRHDRHTLEDLASIGIDRPIQMLVIFTHATPTLQRLYGKAPVISDQRNDLENVVFTRELGTVPFNPAAMLEELQADKLANGKEMRRICMNLALLRSVVPDFPVELLQTVKLTGAKGVAYADADWSRISQLNIEATAAFTEGRFGEALGYLNQSLAMAGDQFLMLEGKAQILEQMGRGDEAQAVRARIRELAKP